MAGNLEQFLDKLAGKAARCPGVPESPAGPSTFPAPRCSDPRVTARHPSAWRVKWLRRCARTLGRLGKFLGCLARQVAFLRAPILWWDCLLFPLFPKSNHIRLVPQRKGPASASEQPPWRLVLSLIPLFGQRHPHPHRRGGSLPLCTIQTQGSGFHRFPPFIIGSKSHSPDPK